MISATNVLVCNSACLCLRMGELKSHKNLKSFPHKTESCNERNMRMLTKRVAVAQNETERSFSNLLTSEQ